MDGPDRRERLLDKARKLSRLPGVYLMKDCQGRVIYVGKAASLPDRVSSYFVPSADPGPKKLPMLELIEEFDTLECEGEWEALLTEARLIKDIHPRFNARLTDDKTFPYLVITLRDEYPGVYITRQPHAEEFKGAKVLGPFTSVYALRESVQLLQRVFKFRTCELEIHDPPAPAAPPSERVGFRGVSLAQAPVPLADPRRYFRPCLLYPIHRCTAPCAAKISREAYRADVDRFIRFLESKRSVMLREMRTEMDAAAGRLEFERAAVLRDQIKAIEKLDERGTRKMHMQPEAETSLHMLNPRKGLESLRKVLGMDRPIRCVECIDIAHLQGNETVGSKVCFIDGRPFKNEYRRYRIRGAPGSSTLGLGASPLSHGDDTVISLANPGDDYAAIREVVSRRYRDAGAGQELYPDVIMIDGGLGQLHAAQEAFEVLGIKPPMVISLAKKEELIHVQARSEPIRLSRSHAGLRLLQAIRDEAHRFAQHYHHVLRRKRVMGEPRKDDKA